MGGGGVSIRFSDNISVANYYFFRPIVGERGGGEVGVPEGGGERKFFSGH